MANTQTSQKNAPLEGDIQKIAVLFTDIVGSTRYFKEHGDLIGRRMLQSHQEIASRPIVEHSGLVVKTLGDSVMAYFSDPKEAVKAAIRIQQELQQYNSAIKKNEQFRVRIGIHWGEGIVEEQDIFGDVVNMAAKILPLAGGGQIVISEKVHEMVKTLAPVKYQLLDIQSEKKEHQGLTAYSVLWDETIRFDPSVNHLLYVMPLWNLGDQKFEEAWKQLLSNRQVLYETQGLREETLPNQSVAVIVNHVEQAIDIAFKVLGDIKKRMVGNDTFRILPLRIVIDSGPYLRAGKLNLEDFRIDLDKLDPGNIYISASAYRLIKNKGSFNTVPPFDNTSPQSLYQLVTRDAGERDKPLFLYQSALAQGKNAPCFYCGARRHPTTGCPSKQLDEFRFALKKLGHLPLKKINDIFRDALSGLDSPLVADLKANDHISSDRALSLYGFYDLNLHLQLRILRNLWDSWEAKWETVKTKKSDGERGGYLWLVQDQLRTSNLMEVERMIKTVILENPQDYRVQCIAGFLEIERGRLNQAEHYLNQALTFAETKPKRIYALFLLSRICELNNKTSRAKDYIDKILNIHPHCADARYQKIIFAFRNRQDKWALAELKGLIKENSEYYIKALIDPELAHYSRMIHPQLKKLYQKVREKALAGVVKAETEMARFKELVGDEEPLDDEINSLYEKIHRLIESESYLGYLDIDRFARSIVYRCKGKVHEWKKKLQKVVYELEKQWQQYFGYTHQFPYKIFSQEVHHQLILLQKEIRKLRDVALTDEFKEYKEAINRALAMSKNMGEIQLRVARLKRISRIIRYLSAFLKKSLLYQTLNLLIGMLAPPVVLHYLAITSRNLLVAYEDVWFYQKLFIAVAGLLGVVLALIWAKKHSSEPS